MLFGLRVSSWWGEAGLSRDNGVCSLEKKGVVETQWGLPLGRRLCCLGFGVLLGGTQSLFAGHCGLLFLLTSCAFSISFFTNRFSPVVFSLSLGLLFLVFLTHLLFSDLGRYSCLPCFCGLVVLFILFFCCLTGFSSPLRTPRSSALSACSTPPPPALSNSCQRRPAG